jgi:hypothetical protein
VASTETNWLVVAFPEVKVILVAAVLVVISVTCKLPKSTDVGATLIVTGRPTPITAEVLEKPVPNPCVAKVAAVVLR